MTRGLAVRPEWVVTEEVDPNLQKHKESSSPDYVDSAPRVQVEGPALVPLSQFFSSIVTCHMIQRKYASVHISSVQHHSLECTEHLKYL